MNQVLHKYKMVIYLICAVLCIFFCYEDKPVYGQENLIKISYDQSLVAAVGKQGSQQCMAYALAYCRTILDGYTHAGTEYWQYGTGGMYGWANYSKSGANNKQDMLKIVYNQINAGNPVCMYVTGYYRANMSWHASGDHWVTVIGYKSSANPNQLTESDFYMIDPGDCGTDYLRDGCSRYNTQSLIISNNSTIVSPFSSVYVNNISNTNAQINATLTSLLYLTEGGFYISTNYDMSNAQKVTENLNLNVKTMWYDMNKWYGVLQEGTTYYYQFYIVRGGTEYKSDIQSFTTTGDGQAPTIVSAYATNITHNGYTVVCTATDNIGIERVCFPTWTSYNGQDDLVENWYHNTAVLTATVGNTYYFNVNRGDHNNEAGEYNTHIYAYDTSGKYSMYPIVVVLPRYMPFQDVSTSSWYFDYVADAYENGYMVGTSATRFNPEGKLTRSEITAVLYNISGKPYVSYMNRFPDVKEGQWYSNSVIWAYRNSIVSGYGNGMFGVSDNITREQLALMIYKYAEVCGYQVEIDEGALNKYSDKSKVSSWAVTAMKWAVTNGIISGTGDNRLNPQGNALRCECAAILKSFNDKYGN